MSARRNTLLCLLLLGGCAAPEVVAPTLRAALIGVWCNSNDGGRSCWAWDEFTERGTLEMCGLQDGDRQPFKASAQVSFTGRRMCYRVVEATDNFWLRPGQDYCTEIVEVDPRSHVYRDLDTGQQFRLWRRPAGERQCPPSAARSESWLDPPPHLAARVGSREDASGRTRP
jgi:hypothetical protein